MLWVVHALHGLSCTLQIVNETIPALQKLKQEGLVKFIGITGYPLDIYTYVLDRLATHFGRHFNAFSALYAHPV